jgi:hypothetical protein
LLGADDLTGADRFRSGPCATQCQESSGSIQQQAQQQAQALEKEQVDAFRKAFSVCPEAKKYVVKY